MSVDVQVAIIKLHGMLAGIPADVMKQAVEICQDIGADIEIRRGVPSLEVLAAAAGILSERERNG